VFEVHEAALLPVVENEFLREVGDKVPVDEWSEYLLELL
jgi:hypothetical protein